MQKAVLQATGKTYKEITNGEEQKAPIATSEDEMEEQLEMWGEQIEAMMPEFPILSVNWLKWAGIASLYGNVN